MGNEAEERGKRMGAHTSNRRHEIHSTSFESIGHNELTAVELNGSMSIE